MVRLNSYLAFLAAILTTQSARATLHCSTRDESKICRVFGLNNETWASRAEDVSADGTTVVGASFPVDERRSSVAFRWTEATGMENLSGDLVFIRSSKAKLVSADGSVVAGSLVPVTFEGGDFSEPFRWTSSEGSVRLGTLPGSDENDPFAMSADGSTLGG